MVITHHLICYYYHYIPSIHLAKLTFFHDKTKEKAQKLGQKRNISYFCKKIETKMLEDKIQLPLEEIKLAFAASCVEGAA